MRRMMKSNGPKPSQRQLKRRPSSCPLCNHPISDSFSWLDDVRLSVDLGCTNCEWYAHVIGEVEEP